MRKNRGAENERAVGKMVESRNFSPKGTEAWMSFGERRLENGLNLDGALGAWPYFR